MMRPSVAPAPSVRGRARGFARSSFEANPYPFYARLRAEAPVCRLAEMRLARPPNRCGGER